MLRNPRTTIGRILTLLLAGTALATTPAQKCESGKNKEAGRYAYCRQKAEAKFATTGDGAVRTAALAKCADRYGLKWTKVESQGGGACPSTGDQVAIQGVLDDTTTNVATALAGGVLADCPGDLLTCEGALSACEAALSGVPGVPLATSQTQCWDTLGTEIPCAGTGQDGELQKGLARAYVDNGDGTITDARTGLMWEKLSDDDSIHDKDSTYTWAEALATKVATLNGGGGFAGYTDWRVPNVNELQSIVNYGAVNPSVSPAFNTGCVPSCTVTSCSCARSSYYWSSSTYPDFPQDAWFVDFFSGYNFGIGKTHDLYARAVRGGS